MTLVIIVAAIVIAVVYLLRPLFTAATIVLALAVLQVFTGVASAAAPAPAAPVPGTSIGLLLVAIEANPDHLRVSEALRLSNPGAPRRLDLTMRLPEGAAYLTFHRGLPRAERTDDGFTATVALPRGLAEVAYSYALPTGRAAMLVRSFPLDVRRLEVVARGGGVDLRLDRGAPAGPITLGGEVLLRWAASDIPAGAAVTVVLRDLPVSRPWLPGGGAGGLGVLLGVGLLMRVVRPTHRGEETSAR